MHWHVAIVSAGHGWRGDVTDRSGPVRHKKQLKRAFSTYTTILPRQPPARTYSDIEPSKPPRAAALSAQLAPGGVTTTRN